VELHLWIANLAPLRIFGEQDLFEPDRGLDEYLKARTR
jgi:hypothetical protein